jgi:hypothetical protein
MTNDDNVNMDFFFCHYDTSLSDALKRMEKCDLEQQMFRIENVRMYDHYQ